LLVAIETYFSTVLRRNDQHFDAVALPFGVSRIFVDKGGFDHEQGMAFPMIAVRV
jgi:hypothetical protein